MHDLLKVFLRFACCWLLALPVASVMYAQGSLFEPAPPPKKSVWFVGIDLSRSVPKGQFESYPAFLRRAVLPFLRPQDTVTVLPFPSDSQPVTFELSQRISKLKDTVLKIDAHFASFEQAPGKQHGSNLGTLLELMNRRIVKDNELARVESFRYRIVLFTDGILDGTQGDSGEALPPKVDYRILVLGVSDGRADESALVDLARENGFGREKGIFIASYFQVDGLVSGLGDFLDLRVNPNLAHIFRASTSR